MRKCEIAIRRLSTPDFHEGADGRPANIGCRESPVRIRLRCAREHHPFVARILTCWCSAIIQQMGSFAALLGRDSRDNQLPESALDLVPSGSYHWGRRSSVGNLTCLNDDVGKRDRVGI